MNELQHIRKNSYLKESYLLFGICLEVHAQFGPCFPNFIYKDAIAKKLEAYHLFYNRNKNFKHYYPYDNHPYILCTDFLVCNEIIFDVVSITKLSKEKLNQRAELIKYSNKKLWVFANFGEQNLFFKKIFLNKSLLEGCSN